MKDLQKYSRFLYVVIFESKLKLYLKVENVQCKYLPLRLVTLIIFDGEEQWLTENFYFPIEQYISVKYESFITTLFNVGLFAADVNGFEA
jgi:hypothetical protein